MSEPQKVKDKFVVATGLDEGGGALLLPISPEDLGRVVAGIPPDQALLQRIQDWNEGKKVLDPFRAPCVDVEDPTDLAEAGWGVLFPEGTPSGVRKALDPLIQRRSDQAKDLFFELGLEDPSLQKFMSHVNVDPSMPAVPAKLPYYLLLVGDPERIPFGFQRELDVQYAVGRLHFDPADPKDPDSVFAAYSAYAEAVVAAEEGRSRRRKELSFFTVENPGDEATRRLAGGLVEKLGDVLKVSCSDWTTEIIGKEKATREDLRRLLQGRERRPSILFTASHGVGFPSGDKAQAGAQGAVVCRNWGGQGCPLERSHYFTAADVPDDVDLTGLISFAFGCYSAGTPRFDQFGKFAGSRDEIAPGPFVARLPQELLRKGALAVIGHVDRAWTSSFSWNSEGGHILIYYSILKQLMDGMPVGWAMETMGSYFAAKAASLHGLREQLDDFKPADFEIYGDLWRETNDAGNFMVLGDPAVRLKFD